MSAGYEISISIWQHCEELCGYWGLRSQPLLMISWDHHSLADISQDSLDAPTRRVVSNSPPIRPTFWLLFQTRRAQFAKKKRKKEWYLFKPACQLLLKHSAQALLTFTGFSNVHAHYLQTVTFSKPFTKKACSLVYLNMSIYCSLVWSKNDLFMLHLPQRSINPLQCVYQYTPGLDASRHANTSGQICTHSGTPSTAFVSVFTLQ